MSDSSLLQLLACVHMSDTYHVRMDEHMPPALCLSTHTHSVMLPLVNANIFG